MSISLSQKDIKEYNKKIAEFIGLKYYPKNPWYVFWKKWSDCYVDEKFQIGFTISHLNFHLEWDWLFHAVCKFNEKGYEIVFYSKLNKVEVYKDDKKIFSHTGRNKKESIYLALVTLILFHIK